MIRVACLLLTFIAAGVPAHARDCRVALLVLGVAQDGGKPQIANPGDPAWSDPARRRHAASLAVVVRGDATVHRYLLDATPDLKHQLQRLDRAAPVDGHVALAGIFLTHAHIGHYSGLMLLGHEAAGARDVPVYAMPRMTHFLRTNGPWAQLVDYRNIALRPLHDGVAVALEGGVRITPLRVPHRQEYSEVVAFRIDGPERSALYLPDIDSWTDLDAEGTRIEDLIATVDVAFLDATFYADGEIPGRDMSGFPHPLVAQSMQRFAPLPPVQRAKIRFIHMNHTNPLHDPASAAYRRVYEAGFAVAREGAGHCLSGKSADDDRRSRGSPAGGA